MSQAKKQEGVNQPPQQRQKQDSPNTNPFAHYVSQKEGDSNSVSGRERRRGKSGSSEKGKDRQSRSRSRQKQHRQFKEQSRAPKRQYDNQAYYRRDRERDRGGAYMYQQRPRKDQTEDHSHFKTRICPLFQKGQCKRGETCTFAHGEKQLRGLPNFKKTRICIPFKNGQCPRSSNECNYAHGQAQLKRLVYDYFPQKNQAPSMGYRPERTYRDQPYRDRDRERERDSYRGRGDRERERYSRGSRYDGPKEYPSKDNPPPPSYPPHSYGPYMSHYSTCVQQKDNAYMFPASMGYGQPGELYPPSSNPPSSSVTGPPPAPGGGSYPGVGGVGQSGYPYGPPGAYEYNYGYFAQNYPAFNSSSSV